MRCWPTCVIFAGAELEVADLVGIVEALALDGGHARIVTVIGGRVKTRADGVAPMLPPRPMRTPGAGGLNATRR